MRFTKRMLVFKRNAVRIRLPKKMQKKVKNIGIAFAGPVSIAEARGFAEEHYRNLLYLLRKPRPADEVEAIREQARAYKQRRKKPVSPALCD